VCLKTKINYGKVWSLKGPCFEIQYIEREPRFQLLPCGYIVRLSATLAAQLPSLSRIFGNQIYFLNIFGDFSLIEIESYIKWFPACQTRKFFQYILTFKNPKMCCYRVIL
jgi:hypothetical protein